VYYRSRDKGENMGYLEVVPAYGRDYKSQKEVKADWESGKDFHDPFCGSYLNKADALSVAGLKVIVRYNSGQKVVAVN
jgi:hypothetical protein